MSDLAPSDKNEIFGDYKFSDTFVEDTSIGNKIRNRLNKKFTNDVSYYREPYSIPYNEVVKHISYTEKLLSQSLLKLEDNFLRKINIDPFVSAALEEAHFRVWDEIKKVYSSNSDNSISADQAPPYISFDELAFCERLDSRASRTLQQEYMSVISHSTFSYLFDFRKLLKLIYNELLCIKNSLYTDFGGGYDNESQQKVAAQYYSWSKMASHYAKRISDTILSKAARIPASEMDKVTEKQSAQLQAIFAIKLNAADIEIKNLLSSLKRDMVDNCDIFYMKYLSPSIRFTKDISDKIETDFITLRMTETMPVIAGEIYSAGAILKGNFISVYSDMIERITNFRDKADNIIMYVNEKRKYCNYLTQMSHIGTSRKTVLVSVDNDEFKNLFRFAIINDSVGHNFESKHSKLDGLLDNDHPQYLLRSGGEITGNVYLGQDATIDGIKPSQHAHTGNDGSVRIKASDIDYTTDRDLAGGTSVEKPLSVTISQFIPEITVEGVHVCDTVVSIEYDADKLNNHEFEITFLEV